MISLAELEAYAGTYLLGVTDGVLAWVVEFSRFSLTAYQWRYAPILGAPTGDANNAFPFIAVNEWNTTVKVRVAGCC